METAGPPVRAARKGDELDEDLAAECFNEQPEFAGLERKRSAFERCASVEMNARGFRQ
jgi:hypothetical protein